MLLPADRLRSLTSLPLRDPVRFRWRFSLLILPLTLQPHGVGTSGMSGVTRITVQNGTRYTRLHMLVPTRSDWRPQTKTVRIQQPRIITSMLLPADRLRSLTSLPLRDPGMFRWRFSLTILPPILQHYGTGISGTGTLWVWEITVRNRTRYTRLHTSAPTLSNWRQ